MPLYHFYSIDVKIAEFSQTVTSPTQAALHRQYWHRLDSADIPPGAKHSFLLLLPFEDVYIQGYAGIPFHGF